MHSFTCSENGWTNTKIGYRWISEVFDPETKAKAETRKRVLILDGHSSHYTPEFLTYARENNIIVLGYPPHCTHALQGLDVVCFARMKETWKKVISKVEEETKAAVSKSDFLHLFGTAYNESFTVAMVKAAFQVTGVYPFNKNAISAEQMKPSTTTSVKGEFPLPQPSPVRAILVAWGQQRSIGLQDDLPPTPGKRIRNEDIDPSLYTPSKRMRTMQASLNMTASGSFLVSDQPYKSSTTILKPVIEVPPASLPQPNWKLATSPEKTWVSRESLQIENQLLRESLRRAKDHIHVRDQVIERDHAQLLYQNLHLYKTNRALNLKENKGKQDRTMLLDNQGQVFTSDSFMDKLEQLEAVRKEKAATKARNADARNARKEALAAVEREWLRIKEQHEVNMKAWEAECQHLTAENVPKRNWPKKPVRPRKPKLPSSVAEIPEDEDENEENGNDNGEED